MKKALQALTIILVSCSLAFLPVRQANAQEHTVSGTVTGPDGSPIPGITVQIKGTNTGTATNGEGHYELTASDDATLVFRGIGFVEQEVAVGMKTVIDVSLQTSIKQLNLVTIAYGREEKSKVTGAIQQVGGEEVANVPIASVDQILQGKVAGLQIVPTSGQPGAATNVRLRGIGSITAGSSPLFVVDGIPVVTGDISRNTPTSNALAGINPNDIESISVLKDAAATSIYGSRAANGVVLITTKKGRVGKTKVTLNVEYGANSVALAKTAQPMTTHQFYEITKEGLINAGVAADDAAATSIFLGNWGDTTVSTNWFDEVTRVGIQQQYNLSISGGNEKTTFYLSGGYFQQEGTTIGSELTRYSGSVQLNHDISNKFKVSTSLNISNVEQKGPSSGGAFRNPLLAAYFLLPNLKPFDSAGNPIYNDQFAAFNPFAILQMDKDHYDALKILGNVSGEYKILDELKFTTRFGVEYDNLEEYSFWNPFYGDGEQVNGASFANNERVFNWIWTNLLEYRYYFNDNTFINAQVGYEAQSQRQKYWALESDGWPPTTKLYQLIVGSKPSVASTNGLDWAIASMFGRVNVNLWNKFSLSGSFRRDGSSRFGKNNRWGNFWAVGGAWNLNNEDFLSGSSVISTLKLRASYGVNGNAAISLYGWRALYGYGTSYNQQPGSSPSTVGNSNLTWEQNKPLNIGVDLGLWQDRVNLTVDWYRRVTDKLLLDVPLSRTSGFSSYLDNVGSMENKGVEITISATPIQTDFVWDISFNIAMNKNKILKLVDGKDIVDGSFMRREGKDFQTWYARQYAGVDPQTGEAQWYTDKSKSAKTTDYSQADRILFGSASPKGFGGLTNTFSYKGITLSAQFNYQWGNYLRDNWARYTMGDGFGPFFNKSRKQLDRWQKPGDITDVPKYVYNNSSSSNDFSSRFLYKGDYIRLRNLTIGYNFKSAFLEKLYMDNMELYLRGTNLWTWVADDNLVYDPAAGITGEIDLTAPTAKSITVGLNITF